MLPDLSTAILVGPESATVVAATPLIVSEVPAPAIVVMMPVLVVIFLMSFPSTVMYMFPVMSNAMPYGIVKNALVARMPSSVPPTTDPPPATVLMMPVLAVIFLILALPVSAM